jgi:hypothetical protein
VFMAVQPVDHVSGDIPDPPDDPDDPPQPGGITRAELDALKERLETLERIESENFKIIERHGELLEEYRLAIRDVVRESTHKVTTEVNLGFTRRAFDGKFVRT